MSGGLSRRGFFAAVLAPLVASSVPKARPPNPYFPPWPSWGKSRLSDKRVQWLQDRINRDYNELIDNITLSIR